MDGKVSKTMPLRNKNAPKVLNSSTPEAGNQLVRTERRAHVEIVSSINGGESSVRAGISAQISTFFGTFNLAFLI